MVTKAQAVAADWRDEFHAEGCKRTTGPRGGVEEKIERYRVSGKCQTWKRDPARFRLPIKYGLYGNGAIEAYNAHCFHRAEDCPLRSHPAEE